MPSIFNSSPAPAPAPAPAPSSLSVPNKINSVEINKENIQKQIYHEYGLCGIANIPNQKFHISSHDIIDLNILLVGNVFCGKSSFINRSLGASGDQRIDPHSFDKKLDGKFINNNDNSQSSAPIIRKIDTMLVDNDVKVILGLIDFPEMGNSLTKKEIIPAIKEYFSDSFINSDKEVLEAKNHIKDERTHISLFFVEEHQMFLTDDDICLIRYLSKKCKVFILIPKADLLLIEEWEIIQARIVSQLKGEEEEAEDENDLVFKDDFLSDLHKNIPQYDKNDKSNVCSDHHLITIFPSFIDERKKLLLDNIDLGLEGYLFKKFLPKILKSFHK